jgi:hypothetical protein
MKKRLIIILLFIIIFIIILLFLLVKKPKIKPIIKEKKTLELPEKEQKIIEKSIKQKIIISKKKAEEIDYDVFMAKINQKGQILWQKNFNNKFVDWAEFICQTNENNYLLLCRSYNINDLQDKFFVIKTDENGNLLWQKDFEEFYISEEKTQKIKDGFITIGRTLIGDKKEYEIYLSATDLDGNYLWTKNLGSKYFEWGYFVLMSDDGTYLIGEDINYPDINLDFYLKKKDINGKDLWMQSYGIKDLNKGYAIIPAIDAGYLLVGVSYLYGEEKSYAYILKIDNNGNKIWEKIFGDAGYNEIFSIVKDGSSGYILAGATNSKTTGLYDVYIIKTDIAGNLIWEKKYGGTGNDAVYWISNCNDGNFILAGVTQK